MPETQPQQWSFLGEAYIANIYYVVYIIYGGSVSCHSYIIFCRCLWHPSVALDFVSSFTAVIPPVAGGESVR